MRFLLFVILLIPGFLIVAQTKETAAARYAERGNLISITNLTGLSECTSASVMGKVGKVKVNDGIANSSVKTENSEEKVAVPLDRLKSDDRSAIFKQLVRKSVRVRIAGYRCKAEDPITVFSIDRIY